MRKPPGARKPPRRSGGDLPAAPGLARAARMDQHDGKTLMNKLLPRAGEEWGREGARSGRGADGSPSSPTLLPQGEIEIRALVVDPSGPRNRCFV